MALRDVSDEAVWSDKEGTVRKVRLSMVTFIRWRAGGFGGREGAGFITVVSKLVYFGVSYLELKQSLF